jgi:hypothetical protein
MNDEKNKTYKTEWSFSFENVGESINNLLGSLGVGADEEIKTGTFSEAIGDATLAKVTLDLTVGAATISDLPDSDNLIEAEVAYIGEIDFASKAEEGYKFVRLGQTSRYQEALKPIKEAFGAFARRGDLRWDIRLTPNIPLDLQINSGVTSNNFDLSKLQLDALKVNGGTGKTDLKLPTMGDNYKVVINSGTGQLDVQINEGANIDLRVNNGTGATNITIGANAVVDAHITGGIGKCTIKLPSGMAARVKATTGLGKVIVPEHFTRIKGGEDFIATSGTWQTADFQDAEHKITIKYEGGLGGLSISQ